MCTLASPTLTVLLCKILPIYTCCPYIVYGRRLQTYNEVHMAICVSRSRTYNPSSTWIHHPFHPLMREARRKTAYDVDKREGELTVSRRQRSREKSAVEHGGRGIKRGTLHDVQRKQRSKEKNNFEGTGREIRLGMLLYASKRAKRIGKLDLCDSAEPSRKGLPTRVTRTERLDSCNSAQFVKSGGPMRTSKIERPVYHETGRGTGYNRH